MPITVDCGENKHDILLRRRPHRLPHPPGEPSPRRASLQLRVHVPPTPDAKVPCQECQPLVGEETFGGVVLTDHVMGGLAEEAERGYDVSTLLAKGRCASCGATIGRAGRSNKQLVEALHQGEFRTAIGITDYSTEAPTTTYYCPACWRSAPEPA